jgi:hypothetical protein
MHAFFPLVIWGVTGVFMCQGQPSALKRLLLVSLQALLVRALRGYILSMEWIATQYDCPGVGPHLSTINDGRVLSAKTLCKRSLHELKGLLAYKANLKNPNSERMLW